MKKKIAIIISTLLICLLVAFLLISKNISNSYASKIFDETYVHEINVEISDEDWEDLKNNPTEKTKYKVNVTIDGETFEEVSFATKGNTSLSQVAMTDSDRYSFKINFGKYNEDQNYYGLNKLSLNNIYADSTYMKDYMSYEIFEAAGIDAPLHSYVSLSINGEVFGLYLALEEVDEAYLERTNDGEGNVYKPESDSMDMNDMGKEMKEKMGDQNFEEMKEKMDEAMKNFDPSNMNFEDMKNMMPEGSEMPDDKNGHGGFGSSANGASLAYTDDEIDSYSDIFDNAETDVNEEDEKRVISALKQLSEGTNLEECLNTSEIIKYFVAHNFILNYDSYTGNMLHNYYLIENGGKLSMIPWDYNLGFGAFSMQGGGFDFRKDSDNNSETDEANNDTVTKLINTGIDTPLSGSSEEDRPMWSWIVNNEEYLEIYHDEYNKLISNYFESGEFNKEVNRVYNMILSYVENDPSAFYTFDEFKNAVEVLKTFCNLRTQSIRLQLDGTLSTKTEEQVASDKVNASEISINDMGGMNMGGNYGENKGEMPEGFDPDNKQPNMQKRPEGDLEENNNKEIK